jgi:oligoendopeptidase F
MYGNAIDQAGEHAATMDAGLLTWDQYMHLPGYTSSYLVGWAAAPKLVEQLERDPVGFQNTYRMLLEKGDALTAETFLKPFGIDIGQPEFWRDRLSTMDEAVTTLQASHKRMVLDKYANPLTGRSPQPT